MRFFTAFLATETNTFAAAPTGWGSFEDYGVFHGDASTRSPQGFGLFPRTLRGWLAEEGHELVESLTAFAMPLGRTVRAVYERLRDEILADLRAAGPVDGVILVLHGAMAADGYDDCEGDLISRVRTIVGPQVPIGVELDLHCHFTERMRRSADAIVAYKEYPHTDALPRLRELTRIVVDAAHGRVKPATAVHDCRMVGLWHTTREPMAGFVRRMQAIEQRPGVLSVSLGHGFPWADVPEAGAKLWVVTDGDPALAQALADELGREFWSLREHTATPGLAIADALARAMAVDGGPVVLADVGDNPGGGAMGDSTFLLRELLAQGLGNVAIGAFWDPGAVRICADAGVGARIALRLGGKCGPDSGDPVDLAVTVKAVVPDFQQPGLGGGDDRMPLGTGVWVQADGGVDIVLVSQRSQVLWPQLFTGLGIPLAKKKLIVVKSAQHFHTGFAPMAKAVFYVASPGTVDTNFARLPYCVRDVNYWPRVADPHAVAATPPSPAATPHPKPGQPIPAPGELHEIDGLRLHLRRSGPTPVDDRAPTIVIEAGAGAVSPVYARLQQVLARKYPVCSYDRPGLGWSQADPEPLDGERNAHRLHALLAAAGVRGPLVLVGHSLGGLLMRIYTGLYPEQVAGLLMLDASHPDQFEAMGDVYDTTLAPALAAERAKRVKLRDAEDGAPPPPELAMVQALFADMPEVVAQMVATYTPEAVDAMLLEMRGKARLSHQAAEVRDLGDRPLAVLWAPQSALPTGDAAMDTVRARWPEYQRSSAALSTRGRVREVPGADHMGIAMLPPFVAIVAEEIDGIMAQLAADR